jgi:TonB family protein
MRYAKPQFAATRIVALGLLFFWSPSARAADVKLVANASVKADSVSPGEIRSIFLAERSALKDGSHVEPVFEKSGATHEAFLREFLRENSESLRSYFGALVFTGRAAMPKSFNSEAEVLAYVVKTRGAIGYVSSSASTEGAKVLAIVSDGSRSERALVTRVEPEYPETLRQLHIGGTVRLQITISPQGRVETVTLLGGNPILGESATKAVQQWIYAAASASTTTVVSIPFEPR